MAAASRKSIAATPVLAPRKTPVRLASDHDQAAPSPALQTQERLLGLWAEAEARSTQPAKWSKRRTLAFIVLTCGGFWATVLIAALRMLR